jgi:hypothetical protein
MREQDSLTANLLFSNFALLITRDKEQVELITAWIAPLTILRISFLM